MRQDALSLLCSHESFFLSCPKSSDPTHCSHSSREVQRNHFDLTTGESLCAVCLSLEPEAQNTIQVRRSSYHDVVKVADIQKIVSVNHVQNYVINGSKVFFLKRRPQPRPPKGAVGASQCIVCCRHLQDVNLYCSMQCMLDGESGAVNVDDSLFNPETPLARSNIRVFNQAANSSGSDSEYQGESMMQKRRKTLPKRAPLA